MSLSIMMARSVQSMDLHIGAGCPDLISYSINLS